MLFLLTQLLKEVKSEQQWQLFVDLILLVFLGTMKLLKEILEELNCSIEWLDTDPLNLVSGEDLSNVNFPLIASRSKEKFEILKPWGNLLFAK